MINPHNAKLRDVQREPNENAGSPGVSRRGFLIGASAFGLAAASTVDAAEAATPMQVSTAKVDITPAVNFPMGGYGTVGPRRATGVNEPLLARCTVFWDNGAPNVIVTADVLAFGRTTHQQIRSRVAQLGVASSDFVLNASHTHNGPVLSEKLDPYISYGISNLTEVTNYTNSLVTKIVTLVQAALQAPRTTCTLDYRVLDEDFSFNRAGLSYIERDVPTLVARASNGKPRAVLFSYGAHPVAASSQTLFDPDYPSEAIKTIEAAFPGVFAQFVLGPAGDQNPVNISGGFVQADAYGYDLGLTIANAIGSPGRSLSGPILSVYSEVSLPLDVTDNPANRQALQAVFAAREANTQLQPYDKRHGQVMKATAANTAVPLETAVPLPVQRWKFAGAPGLTMVFAGGEVVSGYAVYFRNQQGGANRLWFTAYANEVPAYIPSDELLAIGGYEAGWTGDFPGVGGGSMTVYKHIGHFKHSVNGAGGVEQALISAIQSIL